MNKRQEIITSYLNASKSASIVPLAQTAAISTALACLIAMLASLPDNHLILNFMLEQSHEIYVHGTICNEYAIFDNYPLFIESIHSQQAAVYVLTHFDGSQYLGSAANIWSRIKGHTSSFDGHAYISALHIYAHKSTFYCNPIYIGTNYLHEFINQNVGYQLSLGERDILTAFSQFNIRLLEQSIMSEIVAALNSTRIVNFQYNTFDVASLSNFTLIKNGAKIVEIWNADISAIITANPFISLLSASVFLGVHPRVIGTYLNKAVGFISKKLNKRVIIKQPGAELSNDKLIHRTTGSAYSPLVLVGGSLEELSPNVVWAFLPDLVNYIGPFPTFKACYAHLNPTIAESCRAAGSSNLIGSKARSFIRASNTTRLIETELGKYYLAVNPNARPTHVQIKVIPTKPFDN